MIEINITDKKARSSGVLSLDKDNTVIKITINKIAVISKNFWQSLDNYEKNKLFSYCFILSSNFSDVCFSLLSSFMSFIAPNSSYTI